MTKISEQTISSDIAALTFEAAMQELEAIVRKLEAGDLSLEDSIKAYERGNALKSHCQQRLHHARLKVEQIVKDEQGTLTTTPFDA